MWSPISLIIRNDSHDQVTNLRCNAPLVGKYITVQRLQQSGTSEFHIAEIDFKFLYTDFREF